MKEGAALVVSMNFHLVLSFSLGLAYPVKPYTFLIVSGFVLNLLKSDLIIKVTIEE